MYASQCWSIVKKQNASLPFWGWRVWNSASSIPSAATWGTRGCGIGEGSILVVVIPRYNEIGVVLHVNEQRPIAWRIFIVFLFCQRTWCPSVVKSSCSYFTGFKSLKDQALCTDSLILNLTTGAWKSSVIAPQASWIRRHQALHWRDRAVRLHLERTQDPDGSPCIANVMLIVEDSIGKYWQYIYYAFIIYQSIPLPLFVLCKHRYTMT